MVYPRRTIASTLNRTAAMWEQTSPNLYVKGSHMIQVTAWMHDYIIHFGMFLRYTVVKDADSKNTGCRKNSCRGIWLTIHLKFAKHLPSHACAMCHTDWAVLLPQPHPRTMWLLTESLTWSNSSFYNAKFAISDLMVVACTDPVAQKVVVGFQTLVGLNT